MNERQTEDYAAVLALFSQTCPGLAVPRALSDEVCRWIREAADELRRQNSRFTELFQRVAASDYLMGRKAGSPFVARFGWILKPEVIGKILAGQYENRPKTAPWATRTRGREDDGGYRYIDYLPDRDGRWIPPVPDEWKSDIL